MPAKGPVSFDLVGQFKICCGADWNIPLQINDGGTITEVDGEPVITGGTNETGYAGTCKIVRNGTTIATPTVSVSGALCTISLGYATTALLVPGMADYQFDRVLADGSHERTMEGAVEIDASKP